MQCMQRINAPGQSQYQPEHLASGSKTLGSTLFLLLLFSLHQCCSSGLGDLLAISEEAQTVELLAA